MPPHGRRRNHTVLLLFLISAILVSTASAASAVLGIDLGTEYIKAALVKPGIPLEIVLTKDSKRKEAAAVAFKPIKTKTFSSSSGLFPERLYGGDALALTARFPGDVYSNLKPLLGLGVHDLTAANYAMIHPDIKIVGSTDTAVGFKSDSFANDEEPFSIEELLAMQLQNVKNNADTFAGKGSNIKDVVVTVPAFYTTEEKKAVRMAVELAGLRLLAMSTDGLSVGLNYATSRTFAVPGGAVKPEYHIVFDMGAGSTTATVLRFQGKVVKDIGKFNKTIQEVQVLGVGWDKTFGGDALNSLILEDLVSKFVESPQVKALSIDPLHVRAHGRTMAKLWKESERMRHVLSANTETASSFEGLYQDNVNFKYKLSRSDFEKLASVYIDRVRSPIQQALDTAKLQLKDVESIVLHGGAVRTPLVQKELENLFRDADKIRTNVNSDEAAVFGAAFKAAGISASFRVKEIRASETAVYGIELSWVSEGKDRQQKLFLPSSYVGAEKQVPFKITDDFAFSLFQQVPDITGGMKAALVSRIETRNLTASVKNLTSTYGCAIADINTSFSIRLSPFDSLPEVLKGSVSCEVADAGRKGGVVDNVKGLFGFGSNKEDQVPLGEGWEEDATSTQVEVDSTTTSVGKETKSPEPKSSGVKSSEKSKDAKKKVESINIAFSVSSTSVPQVESTQLRRMKDRLESFDGSDRSRRLREEALNTLEAYTYKVRDLVDDEGFIAASTEAQRTEIEEKSKIVSEWLYGDGADATREILKSRLKELRGLVDPIQKRKDEALKRPDEIQSLRDTLERTGSLITIIKEQSEKAAIVAAEASASSSASISSAATEPQTTAAPTPAMEDEFAGLDDDSSIASTSTAKIPEIPEMPVYSAEDLEDITRTHNGIKDWLDAKAKEQEKLSPADDPVILTSELAAKSKELNKVVMDLLQKQMNIPSKPKSSTKSKPSKTSKSSKIKSAKKTKGSKSSSITVVSDVPPVSGTEAETPTEVPIGNGHVIDEL